MGSEGDAEKTEVGIAHLLGSYPVNVTFKL